MTPSRRIKPMSCRLLTLALAAPLALAAAILLVSAVATETALAADVSFKVVDGDSGKALSGVSVTVRDCGSLARLGTGTSAGGGVATVTGLPDFAPVSVAVEQMPSRYTAFPVTTRTDAVQPVVVPLFVAANQWPMWGRDNGHTRLGPACGLPGKKPVWSSRAENTTEFPPSVAYGMAFYGNYAAIITAQDIHTGAVVWKRWVGVPTPDPATGKIVKTKFANQPAVSSWTETVNGVKRGVACVYFADTQGRVHAVDAFTGQDIWGPISGAKGQNFKSFEASPLVVGETLYVVPRYNKWGSKSRLWALNKRTGAAKWSRQLGVKKSSKVTSSPAYAGGRIYTASYDGYVFSVNAANGKLLWRKKIGKVFYGTPTVTGGKIYLGDRSTGKVYCLGASSGKTLWIRNLRASVYSSPAVADGRIFLGSGKRMVALKAGTGAILWSKKTKGKIMGSASVLKGTVYISDFSKRTYGFDVKNGKTRWTFRDGRYSPIAASRGMILLMGVRTLYGFRPGS